MSAWAYCNLAYKEASLFITKAGEATDGLYVNNCKTVMHCVFSTCQPHGTVYCTISECVNRLCRTNFPVLHNPVRVAETNEDLREILNIPKDATVFGAYCGADEYNEEDVVEVVKNVSKDPNYSNVYFIFMNVDVFGEPNERLIFLPGTSDMIKKRQFINTCDAMLYGRKGGETFGISVGEFSICNKPVIARGDNRSDFHITTLGDDMIKHFNYQQCFDIITNGEKYKKDVSNNGYNKYRLENVMKEFVDIVINS